MLTGIFKSVTLVTGVLIYFYLSGGLYLIGYWSSFNLDISNFITLSDIPKNFVFPFIITNAFYFVVIFVNSMTQKVINDITTQKRELRKMQSQLEAVKGGEINKLKKVKEHPNLFVYLIKDINLWIIWLFYFAVKFYKDYSHTILYWGISILLFSTFLIIKLTTEKFFDRFFKEGFGGRYAKYFLFLFPIVCFGTGKYLSLNIYNNQDIRAIKAITNKSSQPIIDSTAFKLLGFLGDKAIISSLDNKKMIVLNQNAYEGLELEEKKDEK